MAQRIAPQAAHPTAAPETNELHILHPERDLVLGGERVIVREYGNVEWLRLLPAAEPLVASMAAALQADTPPTYEDALQVIARHIDGLLPLIAQAVDRDAAWLDSLPAGDVELLLMTWWGVNAHFFVRRASTRVAVAQGERRALAAAAAQAGAASTPPSSPQAIGPAI